MREDVVVISGDGVLKDEAVAIDGIENVATPVCVLARRAHENPKLRGGWLARLAVDPDPSQVLAPSGGLVRSFLKQHQTVEIRYELFAAYVGVPDGVFAAGVADPNDEDGLFVNRWWIRVVDGRIACVSEDGDAARGWLGLPPLDAARREYAARAESQNGLPPLRGTARQVAWATQIRARAVERCPSELLPAVRACDEASWWIDRRRFGVEAAIGSAANRYAERCAEGIGRVLASTAHAACEARGEVDRRATELIVWPTGVRSNPLWDALMQASGKVGVYEAVCAAYCARWQELLAGSSSVMISDADAPPAPVLISVSKPPPAHVRLGTFVFSSTDQVMYQCVLVDEKPTWVAVESARLESNQPGGG